MNPATGTPASVEFRPLPAIDWTAVGAAAPALAADPYPGADAPLPRADVVVVTWAPAEWAALDHVFLDSGYTRTRTDAELKQAWYFYGHNVGQFSTGGYNANLWGWYRTVTMQRHDGREIRVLLFQSNAHLAYAPYLLGLSTMIRQILQETAAKWIYSIGTGGASREEIRLGDTIVTNAAHLRLTNPANLESPLNHQSFAGTGFPSAELVAGVEKHLLLEMDRSATDAVMASLVAELHEDGSTRAFDAEDLVNAPLRAANLRGPRVLSLPGERLLTTDAFYIASADEDSQWCALEMDDAVIAHVAGEEGRDYAFVRNISDPVVPRSSRSGAAIPGPVRDSWSRLVYKKFGLETSFNGALATWALVRGTV